MKGNMHDITQMLFIFLAFVILFLSFVLLFLKTYSKRHHEYNSERKLMKERFQKELFQTQLEIQEQTLKNISQEIHDNIGQALSLAKLNLNTMPPTNDEALQQKILNSKELVSKAITDLRDLSRSLDTDYVQEMGLQ